MSYRIEKDTMGEVQVPAKRLYGAQTQRSRQNFQIGVADWNGEQVCCTPVCVDLMKLSVVYYITNRFLSTDAKAGYTCVCHT